MIDRDSPIPLYHQLSEMLLGQIKDKSLLPGDPFPTEEQLVQTSGVSRITVRKALSELEKKGYIERKHGRGTFVAPSSFRQGARHLVTLYEEIVAMGTEPIFRLLTFSTEPAQSRVADVLQIEEGQPITFMERLRLVDQLAVSLTLSYLHLPAGITLSADEVGENVLWDILTQKGILIDEEALTVEAVGATTRQAKLLQVRLGVPLLMIEGVTRSVDGAPFEYVQVFGRADRFRYRIHLSR
jgi:GntR family transcriptional regulator